MCCGLVVWRVYWWLLFVKGIPVRFVGGDQDGLARHVMMLLGGWPRNGVGPGGMIGVTAIIERVTCMFGPTTLGSACSTLGGGCSVLCCSCDGPAECSWVDVCWSSSWSWRRLLAPVGGACVSRAREQSAMAAMSLSAGVRVGLVMCLW